MAVYLIGAFDVDDWAEYGLYIEGCGVSLTDTGAKPHVVDDDPSLIEGALPGKRITVLEFADRAALDAWYQSDAYRKAIGHRHAASKTSFLIAVDTFDAGTGVDDATRKQMEAHPGTGTAELSA